MLGDLRSAGLGPGCRVLDVALHPHAKASGPTGGAWQWVARFVTEHLPEVVASGHLDPSTAAAFSADLRRAEADPGAVLVTPIVMSVVGRQPVRPTGERAS